MDRQLAVIGTGAVAAAFLALPKVLQAVLGFDIEEYANQNKKSIGFTLLRSLVNFHFKVSYWARKAVGGKPESAGVVSHLRVYPIKSVSQGIVTDKWKVNKHGLQYDRQFGLVSWNDKKGSYAPVTQRTHDRLTFVKFEFIQDPTADFLESGSFKVTYPLATEEDPLNFTGRSFMLPANVSDELVSTSETVTTDLWGKPVEGVFLENILPADFLEQLELPEQCKLVYVSTGKTVETGSPDAAKFKDLEGDKFRRSLMHDYFPLLMCSEEDVQDLKSRVNNELFPVSAAVARPNLVLEGTQKPYDTDNWYHFQVESKNGDRSDWTVAQKCNRCVIPNINPKTGRIDKQLPLSKAMSKHRRVDPGSVHNSFLGVYIIQHQSGFILEKGDKVFLCERRLNKYKDLI